MGGRGVAAVAAAVWLASAGLAVAQDPNAFPVSLDREPLLAWLQRETDIAPGRVVAVTPQALTAVVSTVPASPGASPRLVIRAEALSAETYARTGALSWRVSIDADCEGHKVRLDETIGFEERNLRGGRRELRATEAAWRTPDPGTALEEAWRVACQPDFRGPFQTGAVKVAQTEAPVGTGKAPSGAPPALARTAATKPATAKRGGGVVVQVGASSSEKAAQDLLRDLRGRIGGREAWVETAEVGGRVWRRAVIGGFADGAEAARFCAGLKAEGRGCFVRAAQPGRPA